jgi:hypothetical protein
MARKFLVTLSESRTVSTLTSSSNSPGAVTSEWIYEEKSLEPPIIYDKDFKKLNKIATASRVTTCIDQYKMRGQLCEKVRIKGPGENAIKR